MSIFSEQDTNLARERTNSDLAQYKPTGLQQNAASAFKTFRATDDVGALRENRRSELDAQIKQVESLTGDKLDNPISARPDSLRSFSDQVDPEKLTEFDKKALKFIPDIPSPPELIASLFYGGEDELSEPQRLRDYDKRLEEIRARLPLPERRKLLTRREIDDKIAKDAQRIESENQDVASRATGLGVVGQFAGTGGAAISQPEVLVTLPIGAPVRAGLLSKVLIEAGIGATTEAVLQPSVQAQREELGLESGIGPALENIAAAGAGAGALTGAGITIAAATKAIIKGGKLAFEKIVGRKATKDETALVESVQQDAAKQKPFDGNRGADQAADARNQEQVTAAVNAGEQDQVNIKPPENQAEIPIDGHTIEVIRDVDQIEVDADLMQFKAGGDASGVTDRLKGITEWDPIRAGEAIVYEYEGGRRLIADGHQRLGLAKRLKAEGQNVQLPAFILRESDGVSPQEARAIAALRNIAEGTGSALDAAKVLRDLGQDVSDLNLPPRSSLVRDAGGLANLDQEAFGAVINEVIPQNYGAIVGRIIDDPQQQRSVVDLLAKLKPANANEAESIVRQAQQSGFNRGVQESLFGEEEIAENLFLERARVLDRALKKIRRNIDTFRTLADRGETIEGAGNILNRAANADRLEIERIAREFVSSQANLKGEISDALTEAAKSVKGGKSFAKAADDFAEAITRTITEGRFDRELVSRSLSDPQIERTGTPSLQEQDGIKRATNDVDQFDDGDTQAAVEQVQDLFNELKPVNDGVELDTDRVIPIGTELDASGKPLVRGQSIKDLIDDIEADDEFLEQIKICGVR